VTTFLSTVKFEDNFQTVQDGGILSAMQILLVEKAFYKCLTRGVPVPNMLHFGAIFRAFQFHARLYLPLSLNSLFPHPSS